MFKFLKEKIKQAVEKITHKAEKEEQIDEKPLETAIEQLEETEIKKKEEKLGLERVEAVEEVSKVIEAEEKSLLEQPFEKSLGKTALGKESKEKKGFFGKLKQAIVTRKIDEKEFNELFWELELALLENNVAVEIIEKIKEDLKNALVDKPINRGEIDGIIERSLKNSIEDLFDVGKIDLVKRIKEKRDKPYVIVFFGINGSGKTTTIAKFAKKLQDNKLKCVLVAGDTWRQAAIEQLEVHGDKLGIKVIKHSYGSDPAAVAFDGIQHAKAKGLDVVLIDTAGRLHSNINLMQEMKKIVKVAKPDFKFFIGESITGNDCVEQARKFDEAAGIDGIILTKADVDEKGGAAVSISYITKKPIMYLGVGQTYNDLKEFNKEEIIKSIGL